eukprot:CAMPEP_0175138116 /NCGR_PEP_ID=MMETSP0087-20121206/10172_1 /TAXON_ID=136419 /ORGANISM="Unknown Unknown, Strain D1" /LENGTH=372 /DNA_ID=CAMNT_0016420987 /DNA_START=31 /DNA_END=1146 /DNA_ORIENTATION=+
MSEPRVEEKEVEEAENESSIESLERLPDGTLLDEYDLPPMPSRGSIQEETGGPESLVSVYGSPLSSEAAADAFPSGPGGLIWHAQLVSGDWTDPKHCTKDGEIKPRRPILPVREQDFFSSIVQTSDNRWIFSGVLNGWPGLNVLELMSITYKKKGVLKKSSIVRAWNTGSTATPAWPEGVKKTASVRLTLRSPPWTSRGWSPSSPGFVWWFQSNRSQSLGGSLMTHGESMITQLQQDCKEEFKDQQAGQEPVVTNIHLFAHRYAKLTETNKDKLTYHSAILLEWDHGNYCTVVELATLNGVGGRMGRVNWFDDKLEPSPALYKAMPTNMVLPWKGEFAEIRCSDIKAKNLDEFKTFVSQYVGKHLRFLDVHW